jgi:hypothetical protein
VSIVFLIKLCSSLPKQKIKGFLGKLDLLI